MPRMAPTREFLMEMAKAGVITLPADENAAPGNGAVRGVDKPELVCEAGPVQGSTFRAAVGRRTKSQLEDKLAALEAAMDENWVPRTPAGKQVRAPPPASPAPDP